MKGNNTSWLAVKMLSQQTHLNSSEAEEALTAPAPPAQGSRTPRRPVPKNPFCPKGGLLPQLTHTQLHVAKSAAAGKEWN